MSAPTVPEHILLQVILIDAHAQSAGYRIYDDGRYETHPAGAGWSAGTALTPAQLAAVHTAISAAAPERLESRYPALGPTDDPATLWVQIARDGQTFSIAVDHSRTVPAIEQLSAALVNIFNGQE